MSMGPQELNRIVWSGHPNVYNNESHQHRAHEMTIQIVKKKLHGELKPKYHIL